MKNFFAVLLTFFVATALTAAIYNTPYIGNSNTLKYHRANCRSVAEMRVEHQVPLNSVAEAEAKNFVACKRCRPDMNW